MSAKQLPLFEAPPVSVTDLLTDDERQEQHRLRLVEEQENQLRHDRWQQHNRGRFNFRMCPCSTKECVKARRR